MGFHIESQFLKTLRVSMLVLGVAVSLTAARPAFAQSGSGGDKETDDCTETSNADKKKLKSDESKWNDELTNAQDLVDLLSGTEQVTDDQEPGLTAPCECRPNVSAGCDVGFWKDTMKATDADIKSLDTDSTHGCMKIYSRYGANLQSVNSSCFDMVSGQPGNPANLGCGAVRRIVLLNQKKARIKALNKLIDGLGDRRQKITQEYKDCRKECSDCGTKGAQSAQQVRQPGIGDYLIGGLQAITPMVMGGMGMYENSQALNAYTHNYGAYLQQCTTVGIPCGGPMGGGMMMGGMGMGMGMMPGMMMGGMGMMASGSIMMGGMGMMSGGMGMMPGMMPGMGMMAGGYGMMASGSMMMGGMGMMAGGYPMMGMMPSMGMMPGMMMGGMGMMAGGYGMMASGSMMMGGMGMMAGGMGMMQGGGLYGSPGMFTAGYGMPVYPYGTGFGSSMFPMGPIGGMMGGMMGGGYPGMMGGMMGGGMGMMSGYPMVGQGGFMGPGMMSGGMGMMSGGMGMMSGGMGMMSGGMGMMSGGLGYGFASGGMAGGYNPQYSSMMQSSMQQQMLQAQSAMQSQQDYMIAQQQAYSAQSRLYQMSAGGYGYGYGGLAGGMAGGLAGGLAGGGIGGGARPF